MWTETLTPSVVGILRERDETAPVGTGFLITPRLIATCIHVIVEGARKQPGEFVWVRFHASGQRTLAKIEEADWHPAEDFALLHLQEALPASARPVTLAEHAQASEGHRFFAFGYRPWEDLNGLAAEGSILAVVHTQAGSPNLQLRSLEVYKGMSGAPVLDETTAQVVGMVQRGDTHQPDLEKMVFALPAETLRRLCPAIAAHARVAEENPFHAGGAVPPDVFVGRAEAIAFIKNRLDGRSLQSASIVGERRIGKSSLLRYVAERASKIFTRRPVVVYLDLQRGFAQTRAGWMKALRRELTAALGREVWKETEDGDLPALAFALDDLSRAGTRLILCLDEVEELTQRRAEFDPLLEELRGAGQMGRVGLITASARPLADLCRADGLTSPFYNIFEQATLGLFAEADWHRLVRRGLPAVSDPHLQAIYHLAGGHPFYTQLAARRLWAALHAGEPDWEALALADAKPHWEHQWAHFSYAEQTALRDAAGFAGPPSDSATVVSLRQRGLLHPTGFSLFSEEYARWLVIQLQPKP